MSIYKQAFAGGLALILSAAVQAQTTACPCGAGTVVATTQALSALLVGNTVCAIDGNDTWQEYHVGRPLQGDVVDYKRGPGDPVDPSQAVAAYLIGTTNGVASVRYDYGGGQLYTYSVCQNGGSVNFCGARNILNATVQPGQGPCSTVAQANRAVRIQGR